jgi:crossover junction endodeoxyribonuclease RusA
MTFYFRRPKKHKFSKHPATYPDLSKIIRSTEDALTDAGVWQDDALVVGVHGYKRWVNSERGLPGARIRIWMEEQ